MANVISQVKLPDNSTYLIKDSKARPLDNNDFDTINVTELNAGDLIVTGVGRFTNGLYGDLSGTATQVSNNLKIQLNSGTTEGTNQFTYNGSTAKNINITKSSIGLGNVENKSSATIRGELTSSNVTTALGYTPLNSTLKGVANGLAELDANGLVPSSQLPSYVDDVIEATSKSAFPTTGTTGKIYVALDTNLTYRWSGSAYVEISPSLALGTTSSTAFRGDYGNTAYSHATDSSRLTTATASGLYKVASTAQGHIASLTAVTKADITGLGIPGSDTNTHRPIQVNGTEILGNNTTALNLKAGTNVSLSNSSGTVTITATDTNTTYTIGTSGNTVTLTPSSGGGSVQSITVPYATKATQDSDGNAINTTYFKLSGGTITGVPKFGSGSISAFSGNIPYILGIESFADGGTVKWKASSDVTVGSATTASKLGSSNVGSATQPIYLSAGTATACTYTLGKSVPSDAEFTDTKNTAGSTDTSSKIYLIGATSQAANPQTYSQDTAYVGTDGCVYSGGNKVEVVSNNAGYHNSVYRGKSLGTSITTAQWNAISAGTFDDMYIGDYWTLSTTIGSTTSNIQYVIAGFDYWWNCGDSYPQSSNKHHVVLVPAGNLYSAQMNATNITTGGYIGSAMYTTNLENARTGISTLFGDHLYSVRRLFTNSVNTVGQATGWAWATSFVDLMSETMVYGHPVWTTSGFEVGVDRTILPLFALNPVSASTRSGWWLRSVATPSYFALVGYGGFADYGNASGSVGVRPAFAIY